MNIYIYSGFVILSLVSYNLNAQNLSTETDLNNIYSIIKPLYNGEIAKAKLNRKKFFPSDKEIESIFLQAQILRWEFLPIYDQNDSIKQKYLSQLNQIVANTSTKNEYQSFIELSTYLLLAEYHYNNNLILNASNYGRKAYSILKEKLKENDINNEWLLPTGLYNYFYSYYFNKNFAFQSLLYFFKEGDKAIGLKQLEAASSSESLVNGEALIYLSHIYLRLENEPLKAFDYAQKLTELYPDNLKFYEFYIESSLALQKFDPSFSGMVNQLKSSDEVYFQKYGITYDAISQSYKAKNNTEVLNDAVKFIQSNGGGNHLLSLLYKRLYESEINNALYKAKLKEYKVYDYKLTEPTQEK